MGSWSVRAGLMGAAGVVTKDRNSRLREQGLTNYSYEYGERGGGSALQVLCSHKSCCNRAKLESRRIRYLGQGVHICLWPG